MATQIPERKRLVDRCPQGHLFDEQNTYLTPQGYRLCRTCAAANARRYYAEGRGRPKGWQATRRRVLERDNYTCTVGALLGLEDECSEILDVHHRRPRKWGGNDDDDNLFVVCRIHHGRLEGVLRRIRKEPGWKKCNHNHRYDHARYECELRLNYGV